MPFPFDHKYPGTDLHEIDLGYLIEEIKNIRIELKNFADINKINYANPLEWSITTQYPAFTIVRDAESNILYISMQPVPEGVPLNNADYWQVVGPYSGESDFLKWVICQNNEPDYRVSTQAYSVNMYFWGADNNLYRVTRAVPAGGSFGPSNCRAVTVGDELTDLHNTDADLQDQINNIEIDTTDCLPVRPKRKYIVLMDSHGVNVSGNTGIETWLRSFLGLDATNSWTYAHSSARFGPNPPEDGIRFIDMLRAYDSSIPKAEITDIIVETGGADRAENTSDWQDAIDQFVNYAMGQFPNAQIRVAFALFATVKTTRQAKYNICVEMKQYIMEHPNISWMSGIDIADKDYSAYRNTTHPSSLGYRYFAESIANCMLGESVAYNTPNSKRAYFAQSGTTDVTAWDTNNGITSIKLNEFVVIRFAINVFTINPVTVPAPSSYGANWRYTFEVDLGAIDDNRFFASPQATILLPIPNGAVCFQSLDGHSNQWRYATWSYISFNDVNDECHAIFRLYLSNPGGPDITTPLTITKVRFDGSDHVMPATYF